VEHAFVKRSEPGRSNSVGSIALRGKEAPGGGEDIHGGDRRKIWSAITSLIFRMRRYKRVMVNLGSGIAEVICQIRWKGGENGTFLFIR
jgi:hypothetical protein